MLVQQFFVNAVAHCSYLLGGSKTCAVIDPRRDIQIYLDTEKVNPWLIIAPVAIGIIALLLWIEKSGL